MGYTTDFTGQFQVEPALAENHSKYLTRFAHTRRMKRDPKKAESLDDPVRLAVGLPVGDEGGYFVGGAGFLGQDSDVSVVDPNGPPIDQPGLWCKWIPSDDGTAIRWDGREKFYRYAEWLKYLIGHFLKPWGYTVNGTVAWHGEDAGDLGLLIVRDNQVSTIRGRIVYDPKDEELV